MKKGVLIMLVILALSFSTMISAESLNGFSYSQENILTFLTVENQAVSASVFGGVAVLSVDLSEQVDMYTAVSALADTGLEMEFVKVDNIKLSIHDIGEPREGILLNAEYC